MCKIILSILVDSHSGSSFSISLHSSWAKTLNSMEVGDVLSFPSSLCNLVLLMVFSPHMDEVDFVLSQPALAQELTSVE